MVEARGTTIEFVTGVQGTVDPKDVLPPEWWEIAKTAAAHLTVGYLRGFRPIRQIHDEHGTFGGTRFETIVKPEIVRAGLPDGMRQNPVFLGCGQIVLRPMADEWPIEQQRNRNLGISSNIYVPFRSSYLLLSKESAFYLLKVTWDLKERWSEDPESPRPLKQWYEAIKVEVEGADVPALIAQYPDRPIGMMILRSFFYAQENTLNDLSGQHRIAGERSHILAGYLRRLGEPLKPWQ